MEVEKGILSIDSENIFPIIKKWLYSDTDIFVRELVSNGSDAITKYRKLIEIGEIKGNKDEQYQIKIILDKEKKTISFVDNGIGMTKEEVKKYINNIAFSGATAFVEEYSEKMDKNNEIIGHFGLGFYSSFMVSEKVEINTLSFKEDATAVKWVSDGSTEFEISEGDKKSRGTIVTLYINPDEEDFLDEYKLKSIITKYCGFMPINIYFEDVNAKPEQDEDGNILITEPVPLNDSNPLWLKAPNQCTDEEYIEFYHKVFTDFNDPLFWIHLNIDYPFRLQGILYFPKLKHELESIEGQVKLYNNQVFIADNIKEVVPEFLLLLKGVIDCPDLPLNVSRSFLQNDRYVAQMSGYISKKVADKLNQLFKNEREKYNSYWEDISPFIKYGCIKEKGFYDKIKSSIVFKTINDKFVTIEEYKAESKTDNNIFYVTDSQQQSQYIKLFKDEDMDAVVLTTSLDNPFISYIESYETDVHFLRIDSDLSSTLKSDDKDNQVSEEDKKSLEDIFKKALNKDNLKIQVENLKSDSVSGIIILSEEARRMQEMSKMFGQGMMGMGADMFSPEETLVLNRNNNLIKLILELKDDKSRDDDLKLVCMQIFDLAMISHTTLSAEAMNQFIQRSNKILEIISKK